MEDKIIPEMNAPAQEEPIPETAPEMPAESAEAPEAPAEDMVPAEHEENLPEENAQMPAPEEKKKGLLKKWWFWVIAAAAVVLLIVGIAAIADDSSSGSGSSGHSSVVSYVNPYVQIVKSTENSNYGITYGKAFDSFFSSPSWEYFEATTGEHVVEFEGGFLYDGKPATATIQFVLDLDEGMMEVYHLSINGVAQNRLMLSAMLKKVFESY